MTSESSIKYLECDKCAGKCKLQFTVPKKIKDKFKKDEISWCPYSYGSQADWKFKRPPTTELHGNQEKSVSTKNYGNKAEE